MDAAVTCYCATCAEAQNVDLFGFRHSWLKGDIRSSRRLENRDEDCLRCIFQTFDPIRWETWQLSVEFPLSVSDLKFQLQKGEFTDDAHGSELGKSQTFHLRHNAVVGLLWFST